MVLAADVVAELQAERAPKDAARPWSEEDEALLREGVRTMTGPELAAKLGRSHKAVKHALERRGLRNPRKQRARAKRHWSAPGTPGGPWTEEELWLLECGDLKSLYRSRSKAAVAIQATRIGAPLRSGDGAMSMRQVAERWRLHPNTVMEWIRRGQLTARLSGRVWRVEPDVAERLVPDLMAAARANHGRKGWWRE